MTIHINQIVKGKSAGTFVVIGLRTIDGEEYAQLKAVNPKDHSKTAAGEIALPISCLKALQ